MYERVEVGGRFADLLERRTGIHLSRTNVARVSGVLRARAETLGFPSTDAYLDNIEKNVATTEMQTLVNLVTVGKTFSHSFAILIFNIRR